LIWIRVRVFDPDAESEEKNQQNQMNKYDSCQLHAHILVLSAASKMSSPCNIFISRV